MLGDVIAMGPGKADLLDLIEETGSISAAAKRMSMSYRRAWMLVEAMNGAFKKPLVEASTGGAGGGGARVTDNGKAILALYRRMQADLEAAARGYLAAFQKQI
ncbi:MAG: LysR family transcriptional regulator [Caulobacterales bacterium]|nr:LysR family transcriptional regulator [Caulobacterales bacterium]